jgi:hypothetical protein
MSFDRSSKGWPVDILENPHAFKNSSMNFIFLFNPDFAVE